MSDAQISVIAHIVRTQHDTSAPLDEHRDLLGVHQRRKNSALKSVAITVPDGKFGTIVIDPPWPMEKMKIGQPDTPLG